MHPAAYAYVEQAVSLFGSSGAVLEIGGRFINGGVRPLFPHADYTALDLIDGPGVDVVADVTKWKTSKKFDVVVCCEVFEHAANWPALVDASRQLLRNGGTFIATMAGPGRPPHSAVDGGPLRKGEYYGNIDPKALQAAFKTWTAAFVNVLRDDVRAVAIR